MKLLHVDPRSSDRTSDERKECNGDAEKQAILYAHHIFAASPKLSVQEKFITLTISHIAS